jgi:myo-inositol 2-dehydrogenase/D-chiro-inositol 1-dehydrogenase
MKHGVAIVGTGYMARKHCDALAAHEDARLATICATEKSRAAGEELRERYGFSSSTTSFPSVLSDPGIDIVFVCSPDNSHAGLVARALEAGKHVFCEKPLARSADDFEKIRACLARADRVLQVGMNCRFREQYSIPRQLVADGTLGSLRFLRGTYIVNIVESVRKREKPWWLDHPAGVFPFLHGGGIFTLDLLRWIGGDVVSVFARAAADELGAELEADVFSVSLRFGGGAMGELLVAGSAFRPNDFSLELWLGRGSILGTKMYTRQGESQSLAAADIKVEQKVPDLRLQFSDMLRAIESRSAPLNSFDEAFRNFGVLQAIQQSIHSGRPVELNGAAAKKG